MNSKHTLLVLIFFSFSGCVSKEKFDNLFAENQELKQQIQDLQEENSNLYLEKTALEEKKRQATLYTENDALKFLRDHYEFYNRDMKFRKPIVRKVDYNVFKISLEECTKKGSFSNDNFFWRSSVKTITIFDDGKYNITTGS